MTKNVDPGTKKKKIEFGYLDFLGICAIYPLLQQATYQREVNYVQVPWHLIENFAIFQKRALHRVQKK